MLPRPDKAKRPKARKPPRWFINITWDLLPKVGKPQQREQPSGGEALVSSLIPLFISYSHGDGATCGLCDATRLWERWDPQTLAWLLQEVSADRSMPLRSATESAMLDQLSRGAGLDYRDSSVVSTLPNSSAKLEVQPTCESVGKTAMVCWLFGR